ASRDSGTDTQETAGGDPSAAPETTTSETTTDETTSEEPGASRGRCADSDLQLQVWTQEPNDPQGECGRSFVNGHNTADTTCDVDVAEAALSVEVYRLATNVKVWASIDCTTPRAEEEGELAPDEPEARQIDWTGRQSAE